MLMLNSKAPQSYTILRYQPNFSTSFSVKMTKFRKNIKKIATKLNNLRIYLLPLHRFIGFPFADNFMCLFM